MYKRQTQNEIDGADAAALLRNGVICVAAGANMPSTAEAVSIFGSNDVLYAPGKASNAGGVATSGLEMSQNAMRLSWPPEEVDARLHEIMVSIHDACLNSVSYTHLCRPAGQAGDRRRSR